MEEGCIRWGWKMDASSLERTTTVERTQARAQNVKYGRFADSVLKSHPAGSESKQHFGELEIFMVFKRNSRVPPALRADDLESRISFFAALLQSATIPKKDGENLFFTVEEVELLRKTISVCGAYQYTKEGMLDSRDESALWTTATAGYERWFVTAIFAEQAAKIVHQRYAVLPGFGTFPQTPRNVLQFLDCPEALPQTSFGNDLQFMHSAFPGKKEMQLEHS